MVTTIVYNTPRRSVLLFLLGILFICRHGLAQTSQSLSSSGSSSDSCKEMEWQTHPVLCDVLQRLQNGKQQQQQQPYNAVVGGGSGDDRTTVSLQQISSNDLRSFATAMGWIVDLRNDIDDDDSNLVTIQSQQRRTTATAADRIPVVIAHGMGDSCYNDGMIHITKLISSWLQNVYTVCIPIGTSQSEDTNNGYFLNMNDSIDYFAKQIQQDTQLMDAGMFHAVGLSQGNNIIRGYIAKYNSVFPPVHTFISINGVNAGIGAVPHCIPEQLLQQQPQQQPQQQQRHLSSRDAAIRSHSSSSSSSSSSVLLSHEVAFTMCDLLMEQASAAAYTTFAQKHSFQANYWRDPRPSEYDTYRAYSQLATLNNEVLDTQPINETIRMNWAKTLKFVWVMAQDDRTVWPAQGEQWGAPDPNNPYQHILRMNETLWYQQDYFGLRTAQEQEKNYFESFPGDHLQFSKEDLQRWVLTYL